MIWAVIKDGVVVNTVVASEEDIKDSNYNWINITDMNPQPCSGCTYDGEKFGNSGQS